jgi:hypothetical protein
LEGGAPWSLVIVGGPVILGVVIAWALMRRRSRRSATNARPGVAAANDDKLAGGVGRWAIIGLTLLAIAAITVVSLRYAGNNFQNGQHPADVATGGQAGTGPPLADPDAPPAGRLSHPPQ